MEIFLYHRMGMKQFQPDSEVLVFEGYIGPVNPPESIFFRFDGVVFVSTLEALSESPILIREVAWSEVDNPRIPVDDTKRVYQLKNITGRFHIVADSLSVKIGREGEISI